MSKAKIFFYLSLSFISGIFGASFYYPKTADESWLFFILIGTLILLFVFYKNKKVCFGACLILLFLGGAWLTTKRLEIIIGLDKDTQNFSGVVDVAKEPQIQDRMQKIVVADEKMRFLITANAYPTYGYGDRLKVDCALEIPQNKDGFDYQMYLAKDSIFHICKNPKIEKISSEGGSREYKILLTIKNRLEEKINRLLPAPESGLLIGIILGGSGGLSKEVQDNFSKTGLTHIVAVSGYNVTIVAEYLMLLGIFLGLWRKQAFWFAIGGIFLFVVMVGFPASAVRAGVMGMLILWAMKNGRLSSAQNSIIFACVAMLLFNPLLLRWDVGFQLSFLATVGIVYFYPVIERYSIKKHGISFLSEILFLTLSAQIFVLPIILNNFQKLSVVSPIANVAVLPVIPLTMLLGFLMVVFAFVFPPLATVLAWLTYLPLRYETAIVAYMANLRFSSVEMSLPWQGVAIWYIILAGAVYFFKQKK
jgi:competence protein ComEC